MFSKNLILSLISILTKIKKLINKKLIKIKKKLNYILITNSDESLQGNI